MFRDGFRILLLPLALTQLLADFAAPCPSTANSRVLGSKFVSTLTMCGSKIFSHSSSDKELRKGVCRHSQPDSKDPAGGACLLQAGSNLNEDVGRIFVVQRLALVVRLLEDTVGAQVQLVINTTSLRTTHHNAGWVRVLNRTN